MSAPREEYLRRLEACRRELAELGRREKRVVWGRIAAFFAAAGTLWIAAWSWTAMFAALVLPGVLFVGLVISHGRLKRRLDRAGRAAAFHELGLARLDGGWQGRGEGGERFLSDEHPYARDLDLFGRGSIFEYLNLARTRAGEESLARWLSAPAPVDEIPARQDAVRELAPGVGFREDLAVISAEARSAIDPEAVARWAGAPAAGSLFALAAISTLLGLAGATAVIGWAFLDWGLAPLGGVVCVQLLALAVVGPGISRVVRGIEGLKSDVALLRELLIRIEREEFRTPKLAALLQAARPGSAVVGRLVRRIEFLESIRNEIFAPVAFVLQLKGLAAASIEAWRRRYGARLPGVLEAVGELEALSSLAGYSYEHPEDAFPSVAPGELRFEAVSLGHPLIPEERNVRNDLTLGGARRLLVVSGSNMSGKSTFLRTVGVNAVLAQAGGAVRARNLSMSPLAVGGSIRTVDSLQEGRSRFYAEILRLKQLDGMAGGPLPLLFLADEILHGTNSHDRRIGAEAVLRRLVERGAAGLVTTHDLSLTEIARALGPRAVNVHFQDQIENGRMAFDYKLRDGVVEKSNALALMRSLGFDVSSE
jgi:hypothetical protein